MADSGDVPAHVIAQALRAHEQATTRDIVAKLTRAWFSQEATSARRVRVARLQAAADLVFASNPVPSAVARFIARAVRFSIRKTERDPGVDFEACLAACGRHADDNLRLVVLAGRVAAETSRSHPEDNSNNNDNNDNNGGGGGGCGDRCPVPSDVLDLLCSWRFPAALSVALYAEDGAGVHLHPVSAVTTTVLPPVSWAAHPCCVVTRPSTMLSYLWSPGSLQLCCWGTRDSWTLQRRYQAQSPTRELDGFIALHPSSPSHLLVGTTSWLGVVSIAPDATPSDRGKYAILSCVHAHGVLQEVRAVVTLPQQPHPRVLIVSSGPRIQVWRCRRREDHVMEQVAPGAVLSQDPAFRHVHGAVAMSASTAVIVCSGGVMLVKLDKHGAGVRVLAQHDIRAHPASAAIASGSSRHDLATADPARPQPRVYVLRIDPQHVLIARLRRMCVVDLVSGHVANVDAMLSRGIATTCIVSLVHASPALPDSVVCVTWSCIGSDGASTRRYAIMDIAPTGRSLLLSLLAPPAG